jgi:5'-nucleotidase-like protein
MDETVLGNWAMDVVRSAAGTNAFFSTSSSFRASIPPGPITVEAFYAAIPYKNSIVTSEMTGQQLADLLNVIVSKRGSDNFCQVSGVRFKMQDGKATEVQVLVDPADASKGYAPLDPAKIYKVGATNFMTGVSGIYKPLFAQAANMVDTTQDIGTLLTDTIQKQGTVSASLDGRMGTAPSAPSAPAAQVTATSIPGGAGAGTGGESTAPGMPTTGGAGDSAAAWLLAALVLSLAILAAGFGMRERPAGEKARRY